MRKTFTELDRREAPRLSGLSRRSVLVGAPALLTGCVVTPAAVDGAAPAAGRGYLAMQLRSNQVANLAFNTFGKRTFASGLEDSFAGGKGTVQFVNGERLVVIDVQAGDYMWTLLWAANRQAILDATRFQVHANAITYIGRLELELSSYDFKLRVTDQEDRMRAYLHANYPQALQNLAFNKGITQIRLKRA